MSVARGAAPPATSTFSGLTSRCATPRACRYASAAASWRKTARAYTSGSRRSSSTTSKSSRPGARSMTSVTSSEPAKTPTKPTMFGCRSRESTRASRSSRRGSSGAWSRSGRTSTVLAATRSPVRRFAASRTTENAPRPSARPSSNRRSRSRREPSARSQRSASSRRPASSSACASAPGVSAPTVSKESGWRGRFVKGAGMTPGARARGSAECGVFRQVGDTLCGS
mmetsp:Transcript_16546/g.49406  ORF Transcript_16546/g.49406 Transcript_16546/m.49406 type:complete len:226 (-) Transcript_16546:40-717(-)